MPEAGTWLTASQVNNAGTLLQACCSPAALAIWGRLQPLPSIACLS